MSFKELEAKLQKTFNNPDISFDLDKAFFFYRERFISVVYDISKETLTFRYWTKDNHLKSFLSDISDIEVDYVSIHDPIDNSNLHLFSTYRIEYNSYGIFSSMRMLGNSTDETLIDDMLESQCRMGFDTSVIEETTGRYLTGHEKINWRN